MTHLWEVDHPYYCNLGNFYSNDCGASHKTLADFLDAEGNSDLDMNLVFRWDWREGDDEGASNYTGDDYYRNGSLEVFFMGQRKGAFRYATVEVCRADEQQVVAYLEPRLRRLMELWAPLSSHDTGSSTGGSASLPPANLNTNLPHESKSPDHG